MPSVEKIALAAAQAVREKIGAAATRNLLALRLNPHKPVNYHACRLALTLRSMVGLNRPMM